jgi:hypothetical protein
MDAYPYPDPLTLAQGYFPAWMQARSREILASDGKQAAIEYLARESVRISRGGFNKKMAYQTKPGRKVDVYAMTEKKIFWDKSRTYRIEALADALLARAGQLVLF